MVSLSGAKTLGGVGAILVFIPVLSVVGYILILVAVSEISDALNDRAIFDDIVLAVASGIIGAIAVALIIFGRFILAGRSFAHPGLVILAALAVAWIFLIVSAVFLRRSYNEIANKTGVGTFRTAATLYLVGAALAIVLVGFILLFIAQILQAVAYFSMPDQPLMQGSAMPGAGSAAGQGPAPVGVAPEGTKFCPSCGAQLSANAPFCSSCGAKQP